jgi:hypothetical protein
MLAGALNREDVGGGRVNAWVFGVGDSGNSGRTYGEKIRSKQGRLAL